LFDHKKIIEIYRGQELSNLDIRDAVRTDWDGLDELLKNEFEYHTSLGQYAKGGMMADGGVIGNGKNGYVAFYKGKKIGVHADTMYEAQKIGAKYFNAKKEYEVNVVLAEIDGKQYFQSTIFGDGGMMADGSEIPNSVSEFENKVSMYYAKGGVVFSKEGYVKSIRDVDGKLIKEIVNGGKKYRYNSVYRTYNSVEGNELLHKTNYADGGMMADGGNIQNPTFVVKNLDGQIVFKTKSLNKASDYCSLHGYDPDMVEILDGRILSASGGMMADGGMMRTKYDVIYNSYDQKTGDMIAEYERIYVMAYSISEAKNKAMTMLEEGSRDEDFLIVRVRSMMAKGGYMAKGENYEYVNTFKRYDSNVPVPQEDFEKLVDAYHKQLSGDKLAVSKYKVLKLQMGNYLGHKTVEEMVEYIEKTHNSHKMADGGMMVKGVPLDSGEYKIGKPVKVSPNLYEQKIAEILDNGEVARASDYGRKLSDFSGLKNYPIITKEQVDAHEKIAEAAFEKSYTENRGDYYMDQKAFDKSIRDNIYKMAKGGMMADGMTNEKEKLSNIAYQLINTEDSFKKNNPQAYSQMRDEYKAQFIKVYGKDEYDKRHVMAKGGVLKNATYVSKRNINDIKVEINKSIKDLKGADLLDGVYVKNNALKAKFDAYKSYEELSELNGKIWDKLKIESGSQIYASDSLQKKMAIEYQNMGLDAKFKKFSAAQRKKLAEIMTDENEHSLRNYLTLRGYLGQKEYDSYATTYEPKRPYELNPANYKKEMASGGSIGFEGLSKKVAARYEGKNVKAKFQKQYGKTYDKAEAKEVGDKVAGKVYFLQQRKMADGGKMQGFDDRLDESLAERNNRISKMNATFKARRNESKGENKSLGKRAYSSVSTMDKMASGGKIELPHQLDKYFTKPAGTIEVEMSKLIPIRARKSGIDNAEMYMKKAYDGKMGKRKPIEIYKTRNKKYRVNDGNSTYAVAKKNGWETIYAIVVSNPNVTKTGEKSTFTIAKEIRKEGESWSDAIKRVKENRK
jgi:hypothetical protein